MVTRKQVGQKIATAKNKKPRPEHDFYTTPVADVERALRVILSKATPLSRYTVFDPCAGNGAFRKAINNVFPKFPVTQWDIVQRDEPLDNVADFLNVPVPDEQFDLVIMNPPYTLAVEFVEKALKCIQPKGAVIAFLKLEFLAGRRRQELFKCGVLEQVWVNSGRVTCWPNDEKPAHNSTTDSAWFVFANDVAHRTPTVHWLE